MTRNSDHEERRMVISRFLRGESLLSIALGLYAPLAETEQIIREALKRALDC